MHQHAYVSRDFAMTLEGRIDRSAIPTRRLEAPRGLVLQDGKRPSNEAAWLEERMDTVKVRR